ncbi:MAG: hypothetical protein ACR2QE_00765 [Acidimicrobiales bacterium]
MTRTGPRRMRGVSLVLVAVALASSCGEGTDSAPATSTPVVTTGEPRVDTLMTEVFELAAAATERCGEAEAWTRTMDDASAATAELAAALDRPGRPVIDPVSGTRLADELRGVLIEQHGCADGFDATTSESIEAAMAVAGRASGAYDDLRLRLTGDAPTTASDLWYHSDQIGHSIEMQRLVGAGSPVRVLVVGSSTTKRGIDPLLMTEALGQSTMNAAVAGLFPATMAPWLATARDISGQPTTLVLGVSSFQDFLGCDDERSGEAAAIAARQDASFAPLPALVESPGVIRLIGGPGASYRGAALDEYQSAAGARGLVPSPPEANPAAVDRQLTFYRPQVGRGRYCDNNADALNVILDTIGPDDLEVLVVSLPVSPSMVALHPEGRAGHQVAIDAYHAAVDTHGAAWLDLTDLLDQHEFVDLTHATEDGRRRVTEAVIADLS